MKRIRKVFSIVLVVVIMISLVGCSNNDSVNSKKEGDQRTVVFAPPVLSMLYASKYNTDNIVGANSMIFSMADEEVLGLVDKNYKNIDTSFVGDDFNVNTEALLALKPDLILYYGEMMKKGLNTDAIPMVDTQLKDFDSESLTIKWENLLSDTLKIKNNNIMEKEWKNTHEIIDGIKPKMTEKKRGLYIFSNLNGTLSVSGKGSYGDNFLKSANIENVADSISMEQIVNMEQVNKWNPDVVYIFKGAPANSLLNSKSANQDWSHTNAFKNKQIYDIPAGVYSWGSPCADSPMMPLWLISTTNDGAYSKDDVKKELKSYYKRVYNVELTDELANKIISNKELSK